MSEPSDDELMIIGYDLDDLAVRIDLTTAKGRRGNGAVNQFVDQEKFPGIEVYYGGLHASVHLKGPGIRITMDPYDGDWRDGAWAREQAWQAVAKCLTPSRILDLVVVAATERGKMLGVERAQADMRDALGIREQQR